jgi:hypothetical protein
MGNMIPFILNTILVVGKIIEDKRTHTKKEIRETVNQ